MHPYVYCTYVCTVQNPCVLNVCVLYNILVCTICTVLYIHSASMFIKVIICNCFLSCVYKYYIYIPNYILVSIY